MRLITRIAICVALSHKCIDFPFCQQCGYNRKIKHCRSSTPPDVDVNAIDRRLQQLALFDHATAYSKQKKIAPERIREFHILPS